MGPQWRLWTRATIVSLLILHNANLIRCLVLRLSGVLMSREEIDEAAKICAEAGCWLLLGKWVSKLHVGS